MSIGPLTGAAVLGLVLAASTALPHEAKSAAAQSETNWMLVYSRTGGTFFIPQAYPESPHCELAARYARARVDKRTWSVDCIPVLKPR